MMRRRQVFRLPPLKVMVCKSVCGLLSWLCPFCTFLCPQRDDPFFQEHMSSHHLTFISQCHKARVRQFQHPYDRHSLLPWLCGTTADDSVLQSWASAARDSCTTLSSIVLAYLRIDNELNGSSATVCPLCFETFVSEDRSDSDIRMHLQEYHLSISQTVDSHRYYYAFHTSMPESP